MYIAYRKATKATWATTSTGETAMYENAKTQTIRHFDKTLRELEAKLGRQRGAVATTEEMIEAVKALKDRESGVTTSHSGGPEEIGGKGTNEQKTKRP